MTPRSMDKTASRVSDERLAEMIGLGCDQVARHEAYSMALELQSLRSLSSDSVSDGSKVKLLEWNIDAHTGKWWANSAIGRYSAWDIVGHAYYSLSDGSPVSSGDHIVSAKAAAQSHYERCILSALALDSGTGEQQPVADVCETCGGTGNEATHQICRDCDGLDPTEPKVGVVSEDMVAALKGLVLLKDLFDASDRNQADAYYILAKQDGAWGNARSALTAALPNTTGEAE